MTSATISQGTRMGSTHLFSPALGASVMADVTPIVFVVDDDDSVRESLQRMIRCEGWQPRAFASVEEFFARPPAVVPNCLILDFSFAGLDGLSVQRRVSIERPETPIIFITGNGDVRATVQAMKAGAFEFLTKPFQDDLMLNAIREALERSHVALGHEAEMGVLRVALAPRTAGYGAGGIRLVEQAGRRGTRHQPDHGEGSSWQSHAEDEGRFSPRSCENGWQARASLVKSLTGFSRPECPSLCGLRCGLIEPLRKSGRARRARRRANA